MTREYSSISVETTLAGSLSNSATTMTVAAGTAAALLGGVTLDAGNVDIFTVAIDPDTANEEICYITANSGNDFTIVRGQAGSTAISHNSGATIKHVLTSSDLIFFRNGVAVADGAIPESIVTTKGDVLAASASGVVARVALGTNGYVLTADSTQTAGIKWAAVAAEIPSQTGNGGEYLTTDGSTLSWSPINIAINPKTDNYTLIASDAGKLITMTSSSNKTITVPNGIFAVGQQIAIAGLGTGVVTIDSDGTSVLYATPGTLLRTQYSTAALICIASNTFLLLGDLAV
jgi:hypothetical protein